MQNDDKMTDGEAGRDPRMITTYIATQVMRHLTQVVYRDTLSDRISLLHEVVCHQRQRLGFYRVIIEYNPKYEGDEVTRVSHIFDIQMLLDLGGGWKTYIEKKTLALMQDVFAKAMK